jgi:hypothetical protein
MPEPPIKNLLESQDFTTQQPVHVQRRLTACLKSDHDHILPARLGGASGPHVAAIQAALKKIAAAEPNLGLPAISDKPGFYGASTANAVLVYKKLNGIKRTGQPFDDIVGRMTITRLDDELKNLFQPQPKPVPPQPPPDPNAKFIWAPLRAPLVIAQRDDNPNAQDLENAPVDRATVFLKAVRQALGFTELELTEDMCKEKLLSTLGRGGEHAKELGQFFIGNKVVKLERQMPPFWAGAITRNGQFNQTHFNLQFSINRSLKLVAVSNERGQTVVDVNLVAVGDNQPAPLKQFKISLGFTTTDAVASGDPLAFGIGGIQGHLLSIVSFSGDTQTGFFEGVLRYELLDHFGSNDDDLGILTDEGQPSLWLLQRKMVPNQSLTGFEPYRHRTTIERMSFSGRL